MTPVVTLTMAPRLWRPIRSPSDLRSESLRHRRTGCARSSDGAAGSDGRRVPAPPAMDSSRESGSGLGMGPSVREVIAIALRVASSANPAQAASAGLNPSVTLVGVPRCPLAANTAVEMAMAKTRRGVGPCS